MSIAQTPSAMGLISRLAYARARHAGVAMRPLLGKSGLTRQQLEDPKSRIAVRNQVDFLNRVAVALEDDMLGFDLGQAFDLREAGLIYYVFASSPTLQEVFERGARFTAVVNEGVIQRHIDSRYVGLAISYSGVRRHDDRHQLEFWFAALIRIARHLTGTHLRPVRVRLTHQPGRGHARLSRFLGCRVEFGATTDEILFAREARDLRVVNFDPYLGKLLIGICEQALARGARRKRAGAAAAAWRGAGLDRGGTHGPERTNLCAPAGHGGPDILGAAASAAATTGAALPHPGRSAGFQGGLAARLPGGGRVLACLPPLDRQGAERSGEDPWAQVTPNRPSLAPRSHFAPGARGKRCEG